MKNPLLSFSNQPFGTIPFKDLKNDHFIPAITEGIKNAEITIHKTFTSTERRLLKIPYYHLNFLVQG